MAVQEIGTDAVFVGAVIGTLIGAKANGDGATTVSIDAYTAVRGSNSHGFRTNLYDATDDAYDDNVDGNVDGNVVVSFGGQVQARGQKVTDAGEVSLSVCGRSLSGQAAHITTSPNFRGS